MLMSSLIMLAVSFKKCHYRPMADVGTTESSSSLGSSAQDAMMFNCDLDCDPVVEV